MAVNAIRTILCGSTGICDGLNMYTAAIVISPCSDTFGGQSYVHRCAILLFYHVSLCHVKTNTVCSEQIFPYPYGDVSVREKQLTVS